MNRNLFVLGLMLLVASIGPWMAGRQRIRQASELDPLPEAVSLEKFADGMHTNRVWFHLTDVSIGTNEAFVAKKMGGLEDCVVPLYPAGRDPSATPVQVVAVVRSAENLDEVREILSATPLSVQVWQRYDWRYRDQVASVAPGVDPSAVKLVIAGSPLPSHTSGIVLCVIGAGMAVFGPCLMLWVAIVRLDMLGWVAQRRHYVPPLQVCEVDQNAHASARCAEEDFFVALGFQQTGQYETSDRKPLLHIVYSSPDHRCLLQIVKQQASVHMRLMGVASDGTYIGCERWSAPLSIDGSKFQLPVWIDARPQITAEELWSRFQDATQRLAESELAILPAANAPQLMHYRRQLLDWFTHLAVPGHPLPDFELPTSDEIFTCKDGEYIFNWDPATACVIS